MWREELFSETTPPSGVDTRLPGAQSAEGKIKFDVMTKLHKIYLCL